MVKVDGHSGWQSAVKGFENRIFCFDIQNPLFKNGNASKINISLTYLDQHSVPFLLEYDSSDKTVKHQQDIGVWKKGKTFQGKASGKWKTVNWTLDDALFQSRCNNNDFRVRVAGNVDFIIGECTVTGAAKQSVLLPDIFSSGMILQRDQPIPVWGKAKDGVKITVVFNKQTRECIAQNGQWKVTYPAMPANIVPTAMTIKSSEGFLREISEILIGDLWLASGQSNMEMQVGSSKGAKEATASSANKHLRFFLVPKLLESTVAPLGSKWAIAGPRTTGGFSAVAYYFAREVQRTQKIPVGVISCSYGGTTTETWCSPKVIKQGYPVWEKHQKFILKNPKRRRNTSSYLYKRMLATVMPFPVKGFIWYQGESNAGRAEEQKRLFPEMVKDWRQSWGDEKLPFFIVQLARYEAANWHAFRCAQTDVWQNTPNSFMAVTIDLSKDWKPDNHPVHPSTKAPIGYRLALAARAKVYGEKTLIYSGPLVRSAVTKGPQVILSFDHFGSGLATADGKALRGFYISADNKKFVEGIASLKGNTVVVSSEKIAKPVAVRYGAETDMGRKTLDVNLMNKELLPATPFTIKIDQ